MKVRETGGSSGHTRPGLTLIVSCTVTCSARVKDYYPHINIQTTPQHWYDCLFIWTTAAVASCCSGSCCWCCCCQQLRPALTALLHWIITAPASPVSCTIYYSATLSWILQNCWSSLVMTGDMSCFLMIDYQEGISCYCCIVGSILFHWYHATQQFYNPTITECLTEAMRYCLLVNTSTLRQSTHQAGAGESWAKSWVAVFIIASTITWFSSISSLQYLHLKKEKFLLCHTWTGEVGDSVDLW